MQLLAKLKAQQDADRIFHDCKGARLQQRANLEEQAFIASTVTAVVKRIYDDNILKPDGSNL
ncbi:uncharacterized protein PGTG_18647 [Puccinia graminis f. sp. tritici CRL 75-36-700-3]|uniref:Uncharacterized protein n=1 Tax=Puccinia graminis f. sp. tritici (strain CRL 75-36-700-3 / race SCCL) TaxID=418459 RepID=E3L888_PUCGT|nr:uncharacterized protein PGTG_18647 [Puccinia graminis f. sp. tritici CRL 75-36-700-3]EFP92763.2 hypothetical protein PGTG_18647 [Puccinia graminis f. sp. tritici CRL 75-36-700-3]